MDSRIFPNIKWLDPSISRSVHKPSYGVDFAKDQSHVSIACVDASSGQMLSFHRYSMEEYKNPLDAIKWIVPGDAWKVVFFPTGLARAHLDLLWEMEMPARIATHRNLLLTKMSEDMASGRFKPLFVSDLAPQLNSMVWHHDGNGRYSARLMQGPTVRDVDAVNALCLSWAGAQDMIGVDFA